MRSFAVASLALLLLAAGCGDDDGGAEDGGSDEVTATATFTGTACEYEGVEEITVGSSATFTVVNATEEEVGFALWKVPDGTSATEITEQGIFEVTGSESFLRAEADGDEITAELDVAGAWALNCFVNDGTEDWLDYPVILTVTEG